MGNKTSLVLRDDEVKQISEETGFSSSQIDKLYSRFSLLDRGNCGSLSRDDLLSIPELAINPLCDRLVQIFLGHGANCQQNERVNFRQFLTVLATFRSANNSGAGNILVTNERFEDSFKRVAGHKLRSHTRTPMTLTNTTALTTLASGPRLQVENQGESSRSNITTSSRNLELAEGIQILNPAEESLRRKLLFIFKIYDADNDGKISFNDLRSILKLMVGNYIEEVQLDKIATRAFVEVDDDSDGFIEFDEFCQVLSGRDLDEKLRVKFVN